MTDICFDKCTCGSVVVSDATAVAALKADNERLRAALEEIAKHPRGGRIDTPEKLERDEMIGIARAALEAPQGRINTAQPAAPGGDDDN